MAALEVGENDTTSIPIICLMEDAEKKPWMGIGLWYCGGLVVGGIGIHKIILTTGAGCPGFTVSGYIVWKKMVHFVVTTCHPCWSAPPHPMPPLWLLSVSHVSHRFTIYFTLYGNLPSVWICYGSGRSLASPADSSLVYLQANIYELFWALVSFLRHCLLCVVSCKSVEILPSYYFLSIVNDEGELEWHPTPGDVIDIQLTDGGYIYIQGEYFKKGIPCGLH